MLVLFVSIILCEEKNVMIYSVLIVPWKQVFLWEDVRQQIRHM